MISVGTNIQSNSDALKKITLDYLFSSIRFPKPDIEARIRQLRVVKELDAGQYASLKRQLPYIVCGMFNPPFRKTVNFAYTENFILDIDHIADKELSISTIRQSIQSDPSTLMCFLSPSEDGLKVMFKFKERCYDSALYSIFYKVFLRDFSRRHGLDAVIDSRTSDVCRACFVSHDPFIYYAPDAEPVDMDSIVNRDDVAAVFDLKRQVDQEEMDTRNSVSSSPSVSADPQPVDPDKETMDRIRTLLNNRVKQPPVKADIYVPEQVKTVMEELSMFIRGNGIDVVNTIDISYGKKIQMSLGPRLAEINLFYGKNGYTIVQCPKRGTSSELNELCKSLIKAYLEDKKYV